MQDTLSWLFSSFDVHFNGYANEVKLYIVIQYLKINQVIGTILTCYIALI